MKVTSKQMIAIVKVMMDIMHSDGMEEGEGVYVVNFLRQFKMDDDKMTEIIRASKQMDKDTAYELINGLDQSAKQELSNYLGGLILTDGDVSDEESVILFEMLGDCGIPLPDTQEWEEWVNSSDSEPLSDEDKIRRWLKENDPAQNGCGYKLDVEDFIKFDLDWGIQDSCTFRYDDQIQDLKGLLLYVIDNDYEYPYDLLISQSRVFRFGNKIEYAVYFGHIAVLLIDKALKKIESEEFSDTEAKLMDMQWEAYKVLGDNYMSFEDNNELNLPDLNKALWAYEKTGPYTGVIERGKVYMGLGDTMSAYSCFIQLKGTPLSSEAYAWIGLMYYIKGDIRKALQYWDDSIKGECGLGNFFKGRYLWNIQFYDSAITLWKEGEKKGSHECSCELFQWIVGHSQTPYSEQVEEWRKVSELPVKEVYKYQFKFIKNGRVNAGDFNEYDLLWDGVRSRCPHCLKLAYDEGLLSISRNEFNRIMKAWLYDGIEY